MNTDHALVTSAYLAFTRPLSCALLRYLGRLRFKTLFLLTASLFAVDLFVPDVIPLLDELLLGLATLLFATWRKRKFGGQPDDRPS